MESFSWITPIGTHRGGDPPGVVSLTLIVSQCSRLGIFGD